MYGQLLKPIKESSILLCEADAKNAMKNEVNNRDKKQIARTQAIG